MTFSIVALAMGTICSCLAACLGGIIPLVFAILGLVFGSQAKNLSEAAGFQNSKAKTAITLSIVAIVVIVAFIVLNAILGGVMAANGFFDYY